MPTKIPTVADANAIKAAADAFKAIVLRVFMALPDDHPWERELDVLDDAAALARRMAAVFVETVQRGGAVGSASQRVALLSHAIAFQRQVKLGYGGEVRTIEPHSMRETAAGKFVVYAMRIDAGKAPSVRSYRIDRIESVEVTSEPFVGPTDRD